MFIGESKAIQDIRSLIESIAPSSDPVLIQGETGVGKELVAQAIHAQSYRKERPFVSFNTALFNSEMSRSDLFGYESGAFTGASATRTGLAERAHLGTLFLDEIKEMEISLQTRLLRFLDDGEINKLGATLNSKNHVDVRIISATNTDLESAVKDGKFRSDIFFRLSCFEIYIPPLRDRKEDIPILARHFLDEVTQERSIDHGNRQPSQELATKHHKCFDDAAINFLTEQTWPGNVRQLRFAIRSVAYLVKKEEIQPDDFRIKNEHEHFSLNKSDNCTPTTELQFEEFVEQARKEYLITLIRKHSSLSQGALAIKAGISYKTFRNNIKKYGLRDLLRHLEQGQAEIE